ncbi:MAG: cysteine desulfurase family protein [Chitinophagaceae bacterium]
MNEKRIYLDNAATTPLAKEVLDAMLPYLEEKFGNPSSIYSYGRETRLAIENARKSVAKTIHAHPGEIFFTSCGTESSNMAINAAVRELGCKHIITSPIEHHATLYTTEYLAKIGEATLDFVQLLPNGHIDLHDLERLLQEKKERCLVSLMHANNEIGNLLDVDAVSQLCQKYNAIFHCDTVQTMGHIPIDISNTHFDFITCSAHKFHGPKGVGFIYINENIKIAPYIHGGSQERNMRAGTENLYGIVGLAKALQLATEDMEKDSVYIQSLKDYMAAGLKTHFPEITFSGDTLGDSLYTVLSVGLPRNEKTEMILMNFDIHDICVSGGSACTSGADQGSHVIRAIHAGEDIVPIRFSFSKYNTKEEIDAVIDTMKRLLH